MDDLVPGLGTLTRGVDSTNAGIRLVLDSNLRGRGARRRRGVRLGLEFLGGESQRKGNDLGDVGIGAVYFDGDAEGLAEEAHGFETLLVVGSSASHKDLDVVGNELSFEVLERTDDAFEGGGDVGEIGDTASDNEDLSLGIGLASGDQID